MSVGHNLFHGPSHICGTWFGVVDSVVRVIMSIARAGMLMDRFGQTCFTKLEDRMGGGAKVLAAGGVYVPRPRPEGVYGWRGPQ